MKQNSSYTTQQHLQPTLNLTQKNLYGLRPYTVLIHSIRQSRVTGLPKSTKSHDCHGHFGKVTKPFLGSKNHLKMAQKIVKNRKKVNHCLFTLLIALHVHYYYANGKIKSNVSLHTSGVTFCDRWEA